MSFLPIDQRVPNYVHSTLQVSLKDKKYPLVNLGNGIEIPYPPGDVTPLAELPTDHRAFQYLIGRGYNPHKLDEQFDCGFCTKELTCTKENGVFYRAWEGGFKNTPQNRIIFRAKMNGIVRGWQGRLMDFWDDDQYYILHPYTDAWTKVGHKEQGELVYVDPFNGPRRKLAKYANALGMVSAEFLFGYDSFMLRNKDIPVSQRVVVLTEGPLDAARFPANGLAYTRAHVSPAQARLASSMAGTVVLAYDNDAAGEEYREKNINTLVEYCTNVKTMSPAPFKDFGEAGKAFSTKALRELLSK